MGLFGKAALTVSEAAAALVELVFWRHAQESQEQIQECIGRELDWLTYQAGLMSAMSEATDVLPESIRRAVMDQVWRDYCRAVASTDENADPRASAEWVFKQQRHRVLRYAQAGVGAEYVQRQLTVAKTWAEDLGLSPDDLVNVMALQGVLFTVRLEVREFLDSVSVRE